MGATVCRHAPFLLLYYSHYFMSSIVFSVLKDPEKFKKVFLDEFGNPAWDIDENVDSSIHWNNRIDLCADALYMDSQPYQAK